MKPAAGILRAMLCALLLAGAPHAAWAELRALLVGVSGYPSLKESLRLQGPPVAVQRLRDVLLRRGAAARHITVLADEVAGAARPTRDAILAAFDTLARDAQAGDVVVVQFIGHGSLQSDPARPGTWLPVLLPVDIGPWDGDKPVRNAITRDELRAAVDRITARGAFVWAVFDACHSSGLVRGGAVAPAAAATPPPATEAAASDLADAQALLASWMAGLDAETSASAAGHVADVRRSGLAGPPDAADRAPLPGAAPIGRAAYFYAAQASDPAGELAPKTGGRRHALFSHVLTQLLDEAQGRVSYRQLAEALLARYKWLPQARLTPVFAGNGLDVHVLGQDSVPVRQWPLQARPAAAGSAPPWWVAAGQLQGIAAGARFAVVPNALSRDDQAITQLEVVQVMDDHSLLAPLPAGTASGAAIAPALQAEVNQLRLRANGLAFSLRVAFDASGCATPCNLRAAVQRLRTAGVEGVDLRWVDAGDAAPLPDLLIRADQGRVLLLERPALLESATRKAAAREPETRVLDLPASAAVDPLARKLAQRLHGHARLRNLLQLAARSEHDSLQSVLESSVRRRGAQAAQGSGALALRHGEQLVLSLRNRGTDPLDVTVLYLDADGAITKIHPTALGQVNRLEAGEPREVTVNIGPPAVGIERLWAIAARKHPREPTIDFGFLEQPALAQRRSGSGDAAEIGEHQAAFADAAFAAHLTRREPRPRPPSSRTLIRSHELDVSR